MRTSRETLNIVVNALRAKGVEAKESTAGFSYDISFNGHFSSINTQEVDHLAVYSSSNLESYADSVFNDLIKAEAEYAEYNGTIESEFQ